MPAIAQKKDSITNGVIRKSAELKEKAINSIVRKPEADSIFNFKSESAFLPYEGKIIRRINIQPIHFNKTVQDTTKVVKNKLIQIGESLHTDTRKKTVRNNLFI